MTKIYIIEEGTWDHHAIVMVCSSKEIAMAWCNANLTKNSTHADMWNDGSMGYWIEEYELDAPGQL